ncbi:Helicase [Macleaya cordata]|uniref:ATP-dependent DNA helicase n=1 Tax=Macleaya cordata TaxID=56857 RepID=A0A200QWJ9_MACCD|nr:Helicase [Macleaya cordata]
MEGNNVSSDHVIAELIEMGFEFSQVIEAIEAVGPSIDNAVDFIINSSHTKNTVPLSRPNRSTSTARTLGKRASTSSCSSGRVKQSRIMEHFQPPRPKRTRIQSAPTASISGLESVSRHAEGEKASSSCTDHNLGSEMEPCVFPVDNLRDQEIGSDWEQKVSNLLHKHFGFSSLKSFQKEALEAWLDNQDSLVLAATGSGKSLCFQVPALLTGKVVVVISPLISLMHDQCLKLAKHGVSACFLGSGQTDSSVEQKAMNGMYGVIYVCPETILRLIGPLQRLAENRGIALFAIDEAHCVSKWGHDFRPDYRRLSVLRESFRACNLKFLKSDIPLMALTATATIRVREDILKSLCMSMETKIVLTSFFRPNLRFSVKHSRTSSMKSYEKDFRELIDSYKTQRIVGKKEDNTVVHNSEDESDYSTGSVNGSLSDAEETSPSDLDNSEDNYSDGNGVEVSSVNRNVVTSLKKKQLSVEYLEDELDVLQSVDEFDVACGEFHGDTSTKNRDLWRLSETVDPPFKPEERLKLLTEPSEVGPTIVYVPTRKETLSLAKFFCRFGIKAAAYNAKLPKAHLRQVHKEFHENALEVVVATIAFGMGIDKSNVRRIIHYGWPQSLEAYYQEAGRAGRDGKLADCILYANLSRAPTLLPSKRSEEQTRQAYKMLSDCFRYGMGTVTCRAKTLVEYFGEDFGHEKCLLCDVCVDGPPELQNLKVETDIFLRVLAAQFEHVRYGNGSYDDAICRGRLLEKPNFRMVVSAIREQFPKFAATDRLWWQGLARILEDKGYIREGADMIRPSIKFPEPTDLGLQFLQSDPETAFYVYPEADMLLSTSTQKSFSTFSEWGKGWADPEIRRQRLQGKRCRKQRRKKRPSQHHKDFRTVRGRLTAKLTQQKH